MSATPADQNTTAASAPDGDHSTLVEAARFLLAKAEERGLTLSVAESLTGGQVASTLVSVPGASAVVVGAVVAYATRIKEQVLGVDAARLAATGPVDGEVAKQMAAGVARLMGTDLGLATTGVAGPGAADGHPAGTVHVAVASPWGTLARELHLSGDRDAVRDGATTAVLALAGALLEAAPPPGADAVE
ncbi:MULTISPECIES: CinA family protein [Actinomyces]|uniref:Competence-damaged protein n=1 Tax=Actinomyces glycerinitolerans TaxID=1892869 RepID=A0A1M4RZZ8_9ACTO|nr:MULTISPECIES: nicotinamide-nucleotide amidohydrolase family protein [Actinomyces]RAX19356.1 nicotinamide-nucleotide amidohydrolase family protein [Actinomyces sp. Z5]RAX23581.1 nicotinamide-nucleotide amidohydrolase family protein [Actinomyces sp. Z3]SHE25528.1 competence-damaged protein [Actinomyces glycerinitolerans]